ncbi:class I SAM-dependent DNA methyltransferase [Nocardia sp. alder85J]|uniref:class I SAM-dependent DNA methyltransferase n=1 Tax=Nocardia sp. alder85J TaxID=2862949 RepID=UPI0022554F13|nr:class I SAM-dependent methyltransferase [Nocardia sp. alder85J]MCX4098583.1 class I SAM-dependent methyltransferase [Nocardia sp. alder85J]
MPDEYFRDLYAHDSDPWKFATRWYEERKRALTLAALPHRRYRCAFEPGCGIGILTGELLTRCDRVIATDIAGTALRTAADRLTGQRQPGGGTVELRHWGLGDDWPATHFDLIVLSEVCYYLDDDGLRAVLDAAVAHLDPDGSLVCVHWRREVPEYLSTGDRVHALLATHPGLAAVARFRDDDFLLDVHTPAGDGRRSVAEREGLL